MRFYGPALLISTLTFVVCTALLLTIALIGGPALVTVAGPTTAATLLGVLGFLARALVSGWLTGRLIVIRASVATSLLNVMSGFVLAFVLPASLMAIGGTGVPVGSLVLAAGIDLGVGLAAVALGALLAHLRARLTPRKECAPRDRRPQRRPVRRSRPRRR